jgi:hypothetical protein
VFESPEFRSTSEAVDTASPFLPSQIATFRREFRISGEWPFASHSDAPVRPCCPLLNPLSRSGAESSLRLAPTRLPSSRRLISRWASSARSLRIWSRACYDELRGSPRIRKDSAGIELPFKLPFGTIAKTAGFPSMLQLCTELIDLASALNG